MDNNKTADNNNNREEYWPRAIILVDMNAFFAAVEQLDYPELRGRPVAVTNGEIGTCIITCSYEARRFGVHTGMRLPKAKELCPDLIQRPSRFIRYGQISSDIMHALQSITPDIEIFSVDEAFLDITHCQKLHGHPIKIAHQVKQVIFEVSGGLQCSIGLSGDKTTAKYAASVEKPDGFTVIHPDESAERLQYVPVEKLCGIGKGIKRYLAERNVFVCGDMKSLPISQLAKRFGNIGRRMWYMCQGLDPEPVHVTVPPPKSLGHGKVMPPKTCDKNIILTYLLHMSEKVASRLRCNELIAQKFFIGLRQQEWGWLANKYTLAQPTQDSKVIYALAKRLLQQQWSGQPVKQVQVTALDPRQQYAQLDFFLGDDAKRQCLNQIMDEINLRYGELTLSPARLILRSTMPNVIAPAWKPSGHRRSC